MRYTRHDSPTSFTAVNSHGGLFSQLITNVLNAPFAVRFALAVALLLWMAVLDLASGSEVSFSIFYLVPVTFAGAFISRSAGHAFAAISAGTWGYLEFATGPGYSAAWIPYWNSGVRFAFFVLVNELINQLLLAHATQRAMAREDSLTGIANGRVFKEYAHQTIALSRRSGRAFTVAYIDLDRFKGVNDRFGHTEGDNLLCTVATLISDSLRPSDVVARLGGDEFGILMPDTEREPARASIERITQCIQEAVGERWEVGVTVGAVTFTDPPEDVDHLVHEADALMYRGKREGGGCIIQGSWPGPIENRPTSLIKGSRVPDRR